MKKLNKTLKNSEKAITLIGLVVTIIVLLILAGISISMLSGDNSILQRATDAKEKTERASVIEQAKTDVLGYQAENKGSELKKSQLKSVLDIYFLDVPDLDDLTDVEILNTELKTLSKYGSHTIAVKEIFNGNFLISQNNTTIGNAYDNDWIGRKITYSASSGSLEVSDWIIIGQDSTTKDILITTVNPILGFGNVTSFVNWCNYEASINNSCTPFKSTIGANNVEVKSARSITLNDINNAVGFTIPISLDIYTFGTEQDYANKKVNYYYPDEENAVGINPADANTTWTHADDDYEYYQENEKIYFKHNGVTTEITLDRPQNMKYIMANNSAYYVNTRSMNFESNAVRLGYAHVTSGKIGSCAMSLPYSSSSGVGQAPYYGGNPVKSIRPVVVLQADIPQNDLEIGDYWTY